MLDELPFLLIIAQRLASMGSYGGVSKRSPRLRNVCFSLLWKLTISIIMSGVRGEKFSKIAGDKTA
jgi:hypothetical protein